MACALFTWQSHPLCFTTQYVWGKQRQWMLFTHPGDKQRPRGCCFSERGPLRSEQNKERERERFCCPRASPAAPPPGPSFGLQRSFSLGSSSHQERLPLFASKVDETLSASRSSQLSPESSSFRLLHSTSAMVPERLSLLGAPQGRGSSRLLMWGTQQPLSLSSSCVCVCGGGS